MKSINVTELKSWMDSGKQFKLIDVREPLEYQTGHINGVSIPMGEVLQRISEIPADEDVVIHCKSGGRSGSVCNYLETELGYSNLYNLEGGIMAWKNTIDSSIDVL